MNGKWTPGPWHVADNVRGNGERLIRDSRIPPQLIATVVESDRAYPAWKNAAVIVEAPEMFEALDFMVTAFTPRSEPGPDAHVEHAAHSNALEVLARVKAAFARHEAGGEA